MAIADDDVLLREGLASLLERSGLLVSALAIGGWGRNQVAQAVLEQDGIDVVGTASTGAEALALVARLQTDV
ncbi:hypothetical protein [Kribbella pittospori]|uniref:hypothetical protein n=1 Tax=Kribbella pittospori TaxID=722689 RepID=UPI00192DC02E|nr:hypothetical protein [Kribbella pittospori]